MIEIPAERLRWTARRMNDYAAYWNEEIPLRLHSRETDDGGAPQWHPDFARWLFRSDVSDDKWRRNPEYRVRTTRAFRKLREKFPREYEVLYRTAILGISLNDTAQWMTYRAMRNHKPERYTPNDLLLFLFVATEKIDSWW